MHKERARSWLIIASLIASGGVFAFFVLAPGLNYPLTYTQAIHFIEILVPVFFGYIGVATSFYFRSGAIKNPEDQAGRKYPSLLIRGPVYLFGILSAILLVAFYASNRPTAEPGTGMSVDLLAGAFTTLLSLLAISTNVIIAFLFSAEEAPN